MSLYKDRDGNPTYPATTPNPSDVVGKAGQRTKGARGKAKRVRVKPYALNESGTTPANTKDGGLELKAQRSLANFNSRREVKEASMEIAREIGLDSAVLGLTGLGQIEYSQYNPRWQNPLDLSAGKFLTLLTIYNLTTQQFEEVTGIKLPGRFSSSYNTEHAPEPAPVSDLHDLPHYNYTTTPEYLPIQKAILENRTLPACSYLARSDFAVAGDIDLSITPSTNLLVDTTFKESPYKLVKTSDQMVLTTIPPKKSRVLAGAFHITCSRSLV